MRQYLKYIFYTLCLLFFFTIMLLKYLSTSMPTEGYYSQQMWVQLVFFSAVGVCMAIGILIYCIIKIIKLHKEESINEDSNKK